MAGALTNEKDKVETGEKKKHSVLSARSKRERKS
jgi:hypothetical protein